MFVGICTGEICELARWAGSDSCFLEMSEPAERASVETYSFAVTRMTLPSSASVNR
jgi:hypothetical protein